MDKLSGTGKGLGTSSKGCAFQTAAEIFWMLQEFYSNSAASRITSGPAVRMLVHTGKNSMLLLSGNRQSLTAVLLFMACTKTPLRVMQLFMIYVIFQ